jgi:hypothetical protein
VALFGASERCFLRRAGRIAVLKGSLFALFHSEPSVLNWRRTVSNYRFTRPPVSRQENITDTFPASAHYKGEHNDRPYYPGDKSWLSIDNLSESLTKNLS